MEKNKILIIEDEAEIREGIQILLGSEDYIFQEAENGMQGLLRLEPDTDLVILDVMMPGMDGIEVCKRIREKSQVPILFLSAKAQETDKLIGLKAGGDDYLIKPFSYMELHARVKALLRRYQVYRGREGNGATVQSGYIEIDGVKIATDRNEVLLQERELNLTDTEYRILLLLMRRPNRSYSAQSIYEAIWNESYFYGANSTLMVHMKNLRNKMEEDPHNPTRIVTVWGKGYMFRKQVVE